jgi:hypothetical protein
MIALTACIYCDTAIFDIKKSGDYPEKSLGQVVF